MRTRNLIVFIFFITLILLSSCKAKQVLVSSTSSDSLIVTEKYVERPVFVPGDSVKVSMPILFQDNKPVAQKLSAHGSHARVSLQITPEGIVQAQANCDEYQAKVKVLERDVTKYRHEAQVYQEKETKLQKTISDIYGTIRHVGIITAILVILIITFKYAKPVLSIIKKLF